MSNIIRENIVNTNEQGALEGLQIEYRPDGGVLAEKNFKNGKRQGSFKKYWADGALRYERKFENDIAVDIWKEYGKDGKLVAEDEYDNGTLVSSKIYDDNGFLIELEALDNKGDLLNLTPDLDKAHFERNLKQILTDVGVEEFNQQCLDKISQKHELEIN